MTAENMSRIEYSSPKDAIERGESPHHCLDLVVDGEKIGAAEIDYYSKPLPLYQVSDLYVLFKYQSKGYATQIMEQVEAFLKKRGKPGVLVDAIDEGAPAHGMYERRGWQLLPGSHALRLFNWPEAVDVAIMNAYFFQYTDPMERNKVE